MSVRRGAPAMAESGFGFETMKGPPTYCRSDGTLTMDKDEAFKGGAGMKVIWSSDGLRCRECGFVMRSVFVVQESQVALECPTPACPNHGHRFAPPTFDLAPLPTPTLTGQQLHSRWREDYQRAAKVEPWQWDYLSENERTAWNALADRLKVKP